MSNITHDMTDLGPIQSWENLLKYLMDNYMYVSSVEKAW